MKSLSQSEYGELRSLYQQVYAPRFETILDEFTDEEVDELTEEIIEDVVEEFFLECLEEGWNIESVEETLYESLETSITALNEAVLLEMNPYAPAGSKEAQAYNKATTASKRSAERAAKRKEVIGKVKNAVGKVGSALKSGAGKAASAAKAAYKGASRAAGSAVGTVKKAASVAKSEFKKGYESASKSSSSDSESSDSDSSVSSGSGGASSSGGPRKAVGGALRRVGRLLKKGLKKAVGGTARAISKGADKVATRLGEEAIQEADSIAAMRERAAKRRKQRYGASDTSRGGRDDFRPYTEADYERGEANDPRKKVKEELEATGLFTAEEIESILEAEINEGSYEDRIAANNKKYDANRKRAAQRAAARNAARDAGQTGAVKGVGYVTPRREKETYTDSAGKTRHAKGL